MATGTVLWPPVGPPAGRATAASLSLLVGRLAGAAPGPGICGISGVHLGGSLTGCAQACSRVGCVITPSTHINLLHFGAGDDRWSCQMQQPYNAATTRRLTAGLLASQLPLLGGRLLAVCLLGVVGAGLSCGGSRGEQLDGPATGLPQACSRGGWCHHTVRSHAYCTVELVSAGIAVKRNSQITRPTTDSPPACWRASCRSWIAASATATPVFTRMAATTCRVASLVLTTLLGGCG